MVDLVAWTVLRVKDDVLDADPRVSKVAVPSACHVTAWWFVLVFAFCVCGFLFFWVLLFCFLVFCFLFSDKRDST